MDTFSTFLFANPSCLEGASRVLDFGDTLTEYNCVEGGETADWVALNADWRSIGMDMGRASLQFQEQYVKENSLVKKQAKEAVAAE